MDKRKLVEENKKVLRYVEKRNKEVLRKNADRIADEQEVITKESLSYLGKKIPKNMKDAERKIDEVVRHYKPKWLTTEQVSSKVFFISSEKPKKVKYDINSFYRKLYGIK